MLIHKSLQSLYIPVKTGMLIHKSLQSHQLYIPVKTVMLIGLQIVVLINNLWRNYACF